MLNNKETDKERVRQYIEELLNIDSDKLRSKDRDKLIYIYRYYGMSYMKIGEVFGMTSQSVAQKLNAADRITEVDLMHKLTIQYLMQLDNKDNDEQDIIKDLLKKAIYYYEGPQPIDMDAIIFMVKQKVKAINLFQGMAESAKTGLDAKIFAAPETLDEEKLFKIASEGTKRVGELLNMVLIKDETTKTVESAQAANNTTVNINGDKMYKDSVKDVVSTIGTLDRLNEQVEGEVDEDGDSE